MGVNVTTALTMIIMTKNMNKVRNGRKFRGEG